MEGLHEFKYNSIYELTDLIFNLVRFGEHIWNYDEDFFIQAATKFSKDTLLHLYITIMPINHYHRHYLKNEECLEDDVEKWYELFDIYNINYEKLIIDNDEKIIPWFDKHLKQFELLFDNMADEVFNLLFSNRQFLFDFNKLIAETVIETNFPENLVTSKKTIKRVSIPKWVRTAVYHREKGRCVYCNTDLTGLVNTFTNSNYDHIIPLDLYGVNDPCNIQLTCETCNKKKKNKSVQTNNIYAIWWNR